MIKYFDILTNYFNIIAQKPMCRHPLKTNSQKKKKSGNPDLID